MKLNNLWAFIPFVALLPSCKPAPLPVDSFVVIYDSTNWKNDWVVIVGPSETFLQRTTAPLKRVNGKENREWYVLLENHLADGWASVPGNTKPPFVPGGPALTRTILTPTGDTVDTAFFKEDHAELRKMLAPIEARAEKEPPQSELPAWISSHEFLKRLLIN
jgi:hypothetical protein